MPPQLERAPRPSSLKADIEGVAWAHRTPPLSGLSFRFAVRCDEQALGEHLESLLSSLQTAGASDHCYSLAATASGGIDLYLDDDLIAQLETANDAIDWLLWDINRAVAEASGEHLLFHAGGVQAGAAGVLIPAPSGSGKSTLVAGLVHAGHHYLSDELVALTATDAQLLPYPKPLALKAGSFGALSDLRPVPDAGSAQFRGDEWYLPIQEIGDGRVGEPCHPRLVIVPRFVSGSVTALTPLTRTEAFLALATNSVNLDRHGSHGAELLGDLVGHCDCYQLEMSDLNKACHLVMELLDGTG